MTNVAKIVQEGLALAQAATKQAEQQLGEDKYMCGFAWVEVTVTRTNSKEAKELIAQGFKPSYQPRKLSYWNPGNSRWQNIDVKYEGAKAFAQYLRENGYKVSACERLD